MLFLHSLINTSPVMLLNQWSEAEAKAQWSPRKAETCPYKAVFFHHSFSSSMWCPPCHVSQLRTCFFLHVWRTHFPLRSMVTFPVPTSETVNTLQGTNHLIFCLMQCLGKWWNFWISAGNLEQRLCTERSNGCVQNVWTTQLHQYSASPRCTKKLQT